MGGATGEVVLLCGGQGNGDNGRLLHQYRRGMPLPQLRLLFHGIPDFPLVACSIPHRTSIEFYTSHPNLCKVGGCGCNV